MMNCPNCGHQNTSEQIQSGAELIAEERQRQIDEEQFTAHHDDQWVRGELVRAAASYLIHYLIAKTTTRFLIGERYLRNVVLILWPWQEKWWKPKHHAIRLLKQAGALIAAEIDRLQRRVLDRPGTCANGYDMNDGGKQ